MRSSQGDQDELDIPDSLYSQIKYLAKQSFKNRTLVLVESVTDWDRAYTLLSKDLQQIKVGLMSQYMILSCLGDVSCLVMLMIANRTYSFILFVHLLLCGYGRQIEKRVPIICFIIG